MVTATELAAVVPLLSRSGSAGLAWWAVRQSYLRDCDAAAELQRTYRFNAIQASMHEADIQRTFEVLQSVGVQPLLAKGWVAARLYPEPGLRPYDDIDVLVPPEQHARAAAALQDEPVWPRIDLHTQFAELVDRPLDELYQHAVVASVGDVGVRMLGPEDHLRLLCQHFLRHGGQRVTWLCDVAAIIESLTAAFDWNYCFSGKLRRSEWVRGTLELAARLLGAQGLESCGLPALARPLPRWLLDTFLQEWGREKPPRTPRALLGDRRSVSGKGILEELRCRWPNPVTATIFWRAPFDNVPRLPFQAASYVVAQALAVAGRRWTLLGLE